MEQLTQEAIMTGFPDGLKNGRLAWKAINVDEEENEHFIKDYRLHPKSVVIVDMENGVQVKWKNLNMEQEVRSRLASCSPDEVYSSGWVEYRPSAVNVPTESPQIFQQDIFGTASIMVLSPCIADETKIRLVAHISGDLTEVFPYMNTEMKGACYNQNGPMLTFMEGHRLITLYPRRIAIGKADEIVDAWRALEKIRCLANDTYSRRTSITQLYTMRQKPAALDIYKRLPHTNCRECGQKTCMAFPSHSGAAMQGR